MTPYETGGLIFVLVIALMALGIPVAFAFLGANLVGAFILMGGTTGMLQLIDNSTSLITTFTLVAVPMFVLMGALLVVLWVLPYQSALGQSAIGEWVTAVLIGASVVVALAVGLLIQGLFDPQGGDWTTISEEGMKILLKGLVK